MMARPVLRGSVFFGIVVLGSLLDLSTKSLSFERLGLPQARDVFWVWPNVFGFETALNRGAVFGIGQGRVGLFAGLSIVAALGILSWLLKTRFHQTWFILLTMAFISAGILGNLYDRLGLHGLMENGAPVYAVRDWILIKIGPFSWPNFNLADSYLVVSSIGLSFYFLREEMQAKKKAGESTATHSSSTQERPRT